MKQTWLKKLRVILSIGLFFLVLLAFLDFANFFPLRFIQLATWLQFTPSLIKFIHLVSFSSFGSLIVIALTLLFGRIYCSTICPVGTLQDAVIHIKTLLNKKVRFRFLKARNGIRLSILLLTVATFIAGSMAAVELLDPYSVFGRITVELFRPVVILVNNLIAEILKGHNNYSVQPVDMKGFVVSSFLFALLILAVLLGFSLIRGRLYCNTLCPVGSLLGYISRVSLFRVKLDRTACNQCGACMFVCKAGCIDIKNRQVDFSRCVACFNCLTVCSQNGVSYTPLRRKTKSSVLAGQPDLSKRNFLLTTATLLTGSVASLSAQGRHRGRKMGKHEPGEEENTLPVSPPGSVSHRHFTDACTACYLCVNSCPTQVLQPALAAYGWQGLFQPVMDYKVSFCNYDCVVCTQVCPTGAILPLTFEQKREIQLGKSRFIKRECIVETKKTACGACSEHCPTKAVNMVPYDNGLTIPEVTNDICVGCGACEYACPTDPKAIVVDANEIHLKAQIPKETKKEEKVDYKEEFPF